MGLVTCSVLNGLKSLVINPALKGIGTVRHMDIRDGQLYITLSLEGLDGVTVEIVCQKLIIGPDGSTVTVDGFLSNLPFVQNALNTFAAGTHAIPPNSMVRRALAGARRLIGI